MAVTKKKKIIIPNPALQKALIGFQPIFGEMQDLRLVNRIGDIDKKLHSIDNEALRKGEKLTKKMQEILKLEKTLIADIITRNNDWI